MRCMRSPARHWNDDGSPATTSGTEPSPDDGFQSLRARLAGAQTRAAGDLAGQLVFRILPGGTCELWRGSGEHVKDVAELSVASVLAAAAEDAERTGLAPSVLLVDQALVPALRRALCNTPTTASALPAGRAHNDAVLFSPSQPARRVEIPRGAAVKIIGLQNAADLNGRSATVQRFDASCRRVQLEDGDRCASGPRTCCADGRHPRHERAFGNPRQGRERRGKAPGERDGYLVNGGLDLRRDGHQVVLGLRGHGVPVGRACGSTTPAGLTRRTRRSSSAWIWEALCVRAAGTRSGRSRWRSGRCGSNRVVYFLSGGRRPPSSSKPGSCASPRSRPPARRRARARRRATTIALAAALGVRPCADRLRQNGRRRPGSCAAPSGPARRMSALTALSLENPFYGVDAPQTSKQPN